MINPYETTDDQSDQSSRAAQFMDCLAASQSRVFGYIFTLVPHRADAQDIYQQTVMVLWQKFDQFELGTNFTAWALKSAHFEVLTYRRASVRSKIEFSDEVVAKLAESQDMIAATTNDKLAHLRDCLQRLRDKDRTLVERVYLEQMPVRKLAAALGRTSQSICNSLRRIRTTLLECVDRKLLHTDRGGA
jgi:RNA polymerase sigma-70 factor (ECF subfamily)